ncbi:MAG: peptidase M23 [Coxiellaceae bacterium]|nr:peptidase M23 [Coxiellaceae bacterium]|tara:strand:+ start:479 stop:1624 length:1146 start_codon:yes stop_codon:yes gene_type:complete
MTKQRIVLSTLIYIVLFTGAVFSADSHTLSNINNKISSLKQQLNLDTQNRNHLQMKLKSLDEQSASVAKSIQKTQKESSQKKRSIKKLQKQQAQLESELKLKKIAISKELSAAYIASRQPYLKLLLSQHNSQELNRLSNYYRYLYEYQQGLINNLEIAIKTIELNRQQLNKQQNQLNSLILKQQQQKSYLHKTTTKRKTVIQSITSKIKQHHQALSILTQDKQVLNKTIQQLKTNVTSKNKQAFIDLKGSLEWPTKGKISHRFGTKIQQSELTWAGVVMEAPTGQPVYAIAAGHIVFSKWLSGYGMLVIINHGNGYMSLYGRNQSLYVKQGDEVKAGQQISTVGQTGGFTSPGLYFAIRHNAKPLNPTQWCFNSLKQGKFS